MVLAFKCNLDVEECSQCKGIWIDRSNITKIRHIKNHERLLNRDYTSRHWCSDGLKKKENIDLDYYHYKKEFRENGSIDDIFGFEFI